MTSVSSTAELNGFLAHHGPVGRPRAYDVGSRVDGWCVAGFLGRGGNAEVYRVCDSEGRSAALKVLLKEDAAARTRFAREAQVLGRGLSPFLPRLFATGEDAGRPYLVTELLEPLDLPSSDGEVAAYLLSVCAAVASLHRAGLVHRDLKPSNIMRRADGGLVLIDLGLVKDTVKSAEPERDVSLVSGRVMAVGTPRYAAPEQLTGGAVTGAADIHAIGRLADTAFASRPPPAWLPIIRRATSSIPERRYASVEDLARAIRRRHWRRRAGGVVGTLAVLALAGAVAIGLWQSTLAPWIAWQSLCENVTTNLVVREAVWERPVTNAFVHAFGQSTLASTERALRTVTNRTDVMCVRLKGVTNVFDRPVWLDARREYFVEGPGVLSADLRASGGTVRLHLKNGYLFNRSPVALAEAGIRYVFDGGAFLYFTNQDAPSHATIREAIEDFDAANNAIDFREPIRPKGYGIRPRPR